MKVEFAIKIKILLTFVLIIINNLITTIKEVIMKRCFIFNTFLLSVITASLNGFGMVYYTPHGQKYHHTKNCITLSRSKIIYSNELENAQKQGLDACKVCHCRTSYSQNSFNKQKSVRQVNPYKRNHRNHSIYRW